MGFFNKIAEGLKKTRDSMMGKVDALLNSFTKIDEDFFDELEESLIMADVGAVTSARICENLRKKVKEEGLSDPSAVKGALKEIIAQKMGELVYNGQWFTPLREAISAFTDDLQKTVTGDVTLKLYKGNMINAGVTSPYTLYDEQTASFGEDDDYDQADSAGFINLFGLSIKERAKLSKKWPKD